MSAILSSAQALLTTAGSIFTSAKVQTQDFVLWLLGMEPSPDDANLAEKVSRELSEMAGVLEERKTNWISLTVLFGEHKAAAQAITQTLQEVEERINSIYASKKRNDEISEADQNELRALSSALRGHIKTLNEMSQVFPKQYEKIATQIAKIINNAHYLQLTGEEIASIAGDPNAAAEEVAKTFQQLSEEAEAIYKSNKGAQFLPQEAADALEEIRQQVRNRLGIVHQLREDEHDLYCQIEPKLRAVSSLMSGYTGLPQYNDQERLSIDELRQLPLYGRLDAIEKRLDTIRFSLDQAMERVQGVIAHNRALATSESFDLDPVEISQEEKAMVKEAKRLHIYHKDILAKQIYDEGRVDDLWSNANGEIAPLGGSVAFLDEQIEMEKADSHTGSTVDELIEDASNYVAETARETAEQISNFAFSLFL